MPASRPMGGESDAMFGRGVSDVRIPAIVGCVLVRSDHQIVTGNLGQHRCRSDTQRTRIAFDDGLDRPGRAEHVVVAVDESGPTVHHRGNVGHDRPCSPLERSGHTRHITVFRRNMAERHSSSEAFDHRDRRSALHGRHLF